MIVDVEMPNLGLTLTEATLIRWAKQPGEFVEAGEPLFEIETDKAVQEIESAVTGTVLAHLAQEGDVVELGRVIAKIGTEATDRWAVGSQESIVDSREARMGAGSVVSPSLDPRLLTRDRPVASPRAKRAARRLGIDLAAVQPTGAQGRHIVERDVLAAAMLRRAP